MARRKETAEKPPRNTYRQGRVGVTVYLTPEHRQRIGIAAAAAGQGVGEYLATVGLTAAEKEIQKIQRD